MDRSIVCNITQYRVQSTERGSAYPCIETSIVSLAIEDLMSCIKSIATRVSTTNLWGITVAARKDQGLLYLLHLYCIAIFVARLTCIGSSAAPYKCILHQALNKALEP